MTGKNETEEYRRYCPECRRWVEEAELRVRADGKLRHKLCDTVTAPGAPVPSEMCELAAQMAADEANEGNFAENGPIELRGEAGPELLLPQRPSAVGHDSGCSLRGDGVRCDCSAASTGPLTPGQVMCEVCRLDDRTRAATDPNDLRCCECRNAAAEDIPAGGSANAWERAAATPEPLFPCIRCHGVYPLVGGTLVAHDVPERCPGSGTVPVMFAEVATLKEPRLPVVGPFTAKHLVAEGAVEGRDYVVSPPLPVDFALGQGTVGGQLPCGPSKPIPELEAPAAARVSTIDWSVLGPGLTALVQARQHVWDAGAGSLRDCYCVRGVDHIEEPLSELQAWMNTPRSGKTQIQEDIEHAAATVAFRAPEPPIMSRAAVEQALAKDLRRLLPQLTHTNMHPEHVNALAVALVDCGWVLAARGRASTVTEPWVETTLKEQVLGAGGEVVGYVWRVPTKPAQWYGESIHRADTDTPRFTDLGEGKLNARSQAIGWVLEQDAEAHRG